MKFYLDCLDRVFEVEPIVIEGLNLAVNFGIEFFSQHKVSISCSEKEVKLVTGIKGHERLTRLCSATGTPFPFMNKGKRIDKVGKKYLKVIMVCWKAKKRPKEVPNVNQITEVTERKLRVWRESSDPSAKFVKVRTERDWKGEGFVESLLPEDQEADRMLMLPENAYSLTGSVQAIYVEKDAESCIRQRLGTIHSLYFDKEAWLKEELRGRSEPEIDTDEDETPSETVNSMQESDYPTEESRRKFIWENFKIELFGSGVTSKPLWKDIMDILELKIELEPGAVPKRSRVRLLNLDQRANLKEQLDEWIQQGVIKPANSPWASPLVPVKKKDYRTRWVTDLRLLNDITIKDAYPLTIIQENLQKLKGALIDAFGTYHCIQVKEKSRDCTPFWNFLLHPYAFWFVECRQCV